MSPTLNQSNSADQLAKSGRSFLALGAGNYGAMAISVVTTSVLAHRLGPHEFGHLAFLLMASQVLLLVVVNWSHAGFVRFGAQEFAGHGRVAGTLWARLGLLWPIAFVGVSGVVIGRQPLSEYLSIPPEGIWLLLVHFIALCALSVIGAIFQARRQMARYGVCLFLDKAAMFVCVMALPVAWTNQALPVLACYAASSLVVSLWGSHAVGLRALKPAWPAPGVFRQLARFSVPFLLTSWAGLFGTSWFDLVILKWYRPLSDIGLYSLAAQLAGVAQQVTVIFSTLLLPELAIMVTEGHNDRIRMFMERLLPYWLLATSILFTLVLIAARVGLPLVFGESYSGAAPVLALLMLASVALALYNACSALITAYGATWTLTGVTLVSMVTNVALNLWLIPRYGIAGSAVATVVAYSASAVLVLLFVQHRIRGRLLRLGWFATPTLMAALCFMFIDGPWFYPIATGLAAINVWALVAAFQLFRAQDAEFLHALNLRLPWGLGAGLYRRRGV